MRRREDQGFVLVALIAAMLPLLLVVTAFTSAIDSQGEEVLDELAQERAMLAAEAGVDDALHRGRNGTLMDGVTYGRDLAGDLSFLVEPTYLGTDSTDNDLDGNYDEADEDVFQVVVTGMYRDSRRRVAAYLGPVPLLPPIAAAVTVLDQDPAIELQGSSQVSGHDTNLDGSPGSCPSVPGIAITPPGDVSDLDDELDGTERSVVVGNGGPPSIAVTAAIDLDTTVAGLQNIADTVLVSDRYASATLGTPAAPTISYRDGGLSFSGTSSGAGVLVVTGDLELSGTFRFDGVIIVLGALSVNSGAAEVYGGIIQGPDDGQIDATGTLDVHYSCEAIALANSASGQYVAYNGWQELGR